MLKCKICGCEFNAVKERHYISRDNGKVGLATVFGSNPEYVLYDTFDCPDCGCQITTQERKREYMPTNKGEESGYEFAQVEDAVRKQSVKDESEEDSYDSAENECND